MSDGLVAFAVDRWYHDCCGSLCTTKVTNEGRLELGTFQFEKILRHSRQMVTVAKSWQRCPVLRSSPDNPRQRGIDAS
ncbi:hypothetical protein TNCV_3972501 [Trichonephila clavipes]|nr:hypothetical protein TNCV_3972501 [Trichonephila clavipes]